MLCTAVVLAMNHGYTLMQQGVPTSAVPERVLSALNDRVDYLIYAAGVGFVLSLISLIPSTVRSNAERLIFWAVLGAVSGAFSIGCVGFLYKGYFLFDEGIAADSMPIGTLLIDEMRLLDLLPYGAIVGVALALTMLVISLLREGDARSAARALASSPTSDPDTMIRAQRAERAQQYLAERGQRDPGYSQPGSR